jgi:hypothetical protein
MGRLAVTVTLAVVLTSSLATGCRRKEPPPAADRGTPQAAPAPAATASTPANQPSTPAAPSPALKPPRGAQAMSAAFEAGALPEPATLRPGGPDRQAEALASAVFKRDGNSTAAIYAAVLAAGYGVRKRDGTIVRTVAPGQGIVLDEFEVIGMARLYGLGYGVTLKHLADSFRQARPWKELKLEELLQAGLREAAYSPRPEVKFWALFINELAHRSAAPYDLLGDPDPGVNRLDPIQLQFILARLAADHDSRYRHTVSALRPDVVRASWSGQGGVGGCSSSTVEDYAAVASTSMFGGAAESMGGSAASYGQAVQRANFVLVLMKFIATYASLEHDMQIEGGRLTRTKDLTAGNQTTIRDRVNIKETWAQYVNCARQGLNVAGLDMSFPDAGPVKDVKVWWNIEEGRDTLVFFPFAAGGPSGGGFSSTDENGVAKALITGFPQRQDLSRRRIVAIPRSASVRASAQIKSTKFKDAESVLGTAGDYGSLILAFFTGDPAGAIVGLVTENFYRAAWGYSEPYEFEVLDWEPCENVWAGSINYSETYIEVGYAARPGMNMSRWSEVQKYSASTTITQSRPDGKPSGRSTAQAELTQKRFSTGLTQCYMVNNIETKVKGSAEANAYLSVGIQPDGTYRVGYTLPLVQATGTYMVSTKKEGQCNNPFNMGKDDTQAQTLKLSPEASLQIEGRVDPASPDVLSGSASETGEVRDGVRTARVTWALQRCPSR